MTHFRYFALAVSVGIAATTTGTAAARDLKLQAPPPATCAASRPWQVAEAPIERKRVHPNAAIFGNDATLYVQMSGGNLFTALLLGPMGTALNAHAVKSRTEQQAAGLDTSASLDPRSSLSALLVARPQAESTGPAVTVTPFVTYLVPKHSTAVLRRVTLQIECDGWIGRYSYHLDSIESANLQAAGADQYAAFAEAVRAGENALLELFVEDAAAQPRISEYRVLQSWELNPYFKSPIPEGMRADWRGKRVVVGQGLAPSPPAMLAFMAGVHVIDAERVQVGKVW